MRYYKLMKNAYSCENTLVLKFSESDLPFSPFCIFQDVDLNCDVLKSTSYYDGEFVLEDYVASNLDFPVVTQQCKEIFEKFSIGETEFIPVNVLDRPELQTKLYVMHVRNHVDKAINFDISKCIGDSIAVYGLWEDKVEGNDLFRVSENCFSIFVSQKLAQAIKINKLTGFAFGTVRTL